MSIDDDFMRKIDQCRETIRWSPLWKAYHHVDYDILMECIVSEVCYWVYNKPEYAKEYATWMIRLHFSELRDCAQKRRDNPIPELRSHRVTESDYLEYSRQGCDLIISCYESRLHFESML